MKPVLDTLFSYRAEISKKRLDICSSCEYFISSTTRCNQCGCFIDYKSMILGSACPINKWNKEESKK